MCHGLSVSACGTPMKTIRPISFALALGALLLALLAGCASAPAPAPTAHTAPAPVIAPSEPVQPAMRPPEPPMGTPSMAINVLDYRLDAAYHLYDKNNARIFKGVMPHFLYAIGVLEVQVDPRGNLLALNWMRAPEHAPEVIAEIERTVRQAAPFPAPVQLGSTSYIETWLWDASGNFQLHTLSEGQGAKGTPRRAMPANPRNVRIVSAPGASAR
jgi:periplasmic protein TonB